VKVYALALAVSLAVLFTAGEGRAKSGQELNEACSDEIYFNKGLCSGYINGVFDVAEVFDEDPNKSQWYGGWTACVPAGVKVGQLVEVVKKWLREHPEDWHYNASSLVAEAFSKTWPCP
jgi:hypothetical protein